MYEKYFILYKFDEKFILIFESYYYILIIYDFSVSNFLRNNIFFKK